MISTMNESSMPIQKSGRSVNSLAKGDNLFWFHWSHFRLTNLVLKIEPTQGRISVYAQEKGLLRSFLYASFLILKIMPQRVFKGRLRIVFDQSLSRIRTSGSIILLK